MGPLVDPDEVMEIRKIVGERKIRFLDKAHFSSALAAYHLNEEEANKWIAKRRKSNPKGAGSARKRLPSGGSSTLAAKRRRPSDPQ